MQDENTIEKTPLALISDELWIACSNQEIADLANRGKTTVFGYRKRHNKPAHVIPTSYDQITDQMWRQKTNTIISTEIGVTPSNVGQYRKRNKKPLCWSALTNHFWKQRGNVEIGEKMHVRASCVATYRSRHRKPKCNIGGRQASSAYRKKAFIMSLTDRDLASPGIVLWRARQEGVRGITDAMIKRIKKVRNEMPV
jgi:hypothetical protein